MRCLNLVVLAAMVVPCASVASAQAPARNPYPEGPALLFREGWQQPPGAKAVGQGDGTRHGTRREYRRGSLINSPCSPRTRVVPRVGFQDHRYRRLGHLSAVTICLILRTLI